MLTFVRAVATCCCLEFPESILRSWTISNWYGKLQPLPPPIPHRVSWLSGASGRGEPRWIRHGNSSSQCMAGKYLSSTSPQALYPAISIYLYILIHILTTSPLDDALWLYSHYRGRRQQHHFLGGFPDCFRHSASTSRCLEGAQSRAALRR